MRHFILRLILFALPFGGTVVFLLVDEPPTEYRFNEMQKDVRTGNWFYRRVLLSQRPIDVAFIGSSKTMCAVHDALLESNLREAGCTELRIANCGVNWFGTNMQWLLLRHVVEQRKPKIVVVEIGFDIRAESH